MGSQPGTVARREILIRMQVDTLFLPLGLVQIKFEQPLHILSIMHQRTHRLVNHMHCRKKSPIPIPNPR